MSNGPVEESLAMPTLVMSQCAGIRGSLAVPSKGLSLRKRNGGPQAKNQILNIRCCASCFVSFEPSIWYAFSVTSWLGCTCTGLVAPAKVMVPPATTDNGSPPFQAREVWRSEKVEKLEE